MIEYTTTRHSGPRQDTIVREKKVGDSLISLVRFELGWGGQVIEMTETRITTRTPIFDFIDITTFEGSIDEMRVLVVATSLFYELQDDDTLKSRATQGALNTISHLREGLSPRNIKDFGPVLANGEFVKAALVGAMCTDPALLETILLRPIDDVADAIEMGLDANEMGVALELLTEA
ncbi:MAG: hypothetical protein WBP22_03635 [Candidatus Saccharimonas sp.]